ncbi:UbiA prenyltransferase family-domain-containing protein [Kalaharituber pfeilii]|nr:UbiA prenyltransferase family-domain-containing protein [Kalaharituber pfeilii]
MPDVMSPARLYASFIPHVTNTKPSIIPTPEQAPSRVQSSEPRVSPTIEVPNRETERRMHTIQAALQLAQSDAITGCVGKWGIGSKTGGVCSRCALRLESLGGNLRIRQIRGVSSTAEGRLRPYFDKSEPGYFLGNERLFVGASRRWSTGQVSTAGVAEVTSGNVSDGSVLRESGDLQPPLTGPTGVLGEVHLKQQQLQQQLHQPSPLPAHVLPGSGSPTAIIPPDASAQLSKAATKASSHKRRFFTYLALTKPRLTALIVLSAACSYAIFPLSPLLSSPDTPSLSTLTLLYLTVGTALASAAANTLNMYMEPTYDAQMSRTRNRPLARGLLSGRQAVIFAFLCGTAGTTALWFGVGPTVAGLGVANIFLYAGIYTPMKRLSVVNTWVGAVVGGIPPLMGWAAAATAVSSVPYHDDKTGSPIPWGWLLFSLLFAWQFPHFNALSTTIAEEYKAAGYQMMSWKYPQMNARVALRYSILCFPICFGLTAVGVTDKGFLITSSVVNAWLVREAWRFWNARGLFWASVWHLPGVMVLAMVHKEGLWRRIYTAVWGTRDDEDDEWLN